MKKIKLVIITLCLLLVGLIGYNSEVVDEPQGNETEINKEWVAPVDVMNTDNLNTAEHSARTIEDYAYDYIESLILDLNVFREDDGSVTPAVITDTRINRLEKAIEFNHIFPEPIEIWRLDFMLQTEDIEDGNVRWGTFAPDADGWLGQHTGWNDANILLVFARYESGLEFLWHIPWKFELHTNTETIWGLETALRSVLELRGYINPSTFIDGDLRLVYFDMGGHEYGRLLLSQPFGLDGIWIVERWQQVGNNTTMIREHHQFDTHLALPYNMDFDQTFLEHAEKLQRQFDEGLAPWLVSPYESARAYLNSQGLDENYAPIIAVFEPESVFPFSLPVHVFKNDADGSSHMPLQDASKNNNIVTVLSSDLPEGFAGFSLILHEMYALAAWVNNDGFFIVPNNYGHWHMSIAQLTDYSSAEEWVYTMIERANIESQILAGVDANRTYKPPTAEFPFFAMERMPANEDGDLTQRFARDNGKGGIFLINILLSPEEWEDGHGSRLLEALASFEVLQ
jgi:hypothetical protein